MKPEIKSRKRFEKNAVLSESSYKGVNQRSTDVTQIQQQRSDSSTVTLRWHASKHNVHNRLWWSLCTLYLLGCQVTVVFV